ncbi:bifunctional phosphoribosyl-AMP cyclohydrolase/phosphoribosyl-ATP diphosphatase HisIE [Buchnera aphidicola (Mindarus keteleerifoliae)]|uniref:bifunctional phosphoribosyl-AMP cyclohydrolase/phosphoribosyl-ATP diphosphatase HisIE n=1 Tax=Buchnera aphidicola TaxID=9 RepID=UPI0031B6AD37
MLKNKDLILKIDWKKVNYLVPAIIQNQYSGTVLMQGYMNKEALLKTQEKKLVTFYSRTKKRLWTKGEVSKNFLIVKKIFLDCDSDSLLILVSSSVNTCHLAKESCFNVKHTYFSFLYNLEQILESKKKLDVGDKSYTNRLYQKGIERISQKVGEEAIEVIIAFISQNKKEMVNESSDLIYHLLVLLKKSNLTFNAIIKNLISRSKKNFSESYFK